MDCSCHLFFPPTPLTSCRVKRITLSTIPISNSVALARRQRLLFLATICTGSLLLFLVQPMIARMALPRLGGAPAVWNSAMLVYQALLLAGYAYAHWLGRLPVRRQAYIHIAFFCIAGLTLPIALSDAHPASNSNPVLWVPWLLLISIGPLFFVIAAQAPLMQRWFTLSGGDNPYPLYAASNLGSFTGLLAYPLVVEPLMKTSSQSMLWSAGYVVVALLTVACALRLPKKSVVTPMTTVTAAVPSWRHVMQWIMLAAIASGLMLSTSLHLTTDIAAIPLLWIIPLGLYLLSFTVAFSEYRGLANLMAKLAPFALLFAGFVTFIGGGLAPHRLVVLIVINFFIIACALHTRMYDLRPAPTHLTYFYLAMSIGGVIGGIFCALVAPLIFDWTYEHPILLIAAALTITFPVLFRNIERFWQTRTNPEHYKFAIFIALLLIVLICSDLLFPTSYQVKAIFGVIVIALGVFCSGRRLLFVSALIAIMLCVKGWETLQRSASEGRMTRSYFGVYSINPIGNSATALMHGTTLHGVQMHDRQLRTQATTYYTQSSGVGVAMMAVPALFGDNARIGVVGLGSGALACYSKPSQSWRFYEIDPVVETIAGNQKHFTFISQCRPDLPVVIGDARLTIAQQPANSADLLVIDAFTSDAVPVHLLTQEAFATYRRHLSPNGLLLFHISNRFLDFRPVLGAMIEDGWTGRVRTTNKAGPGEDNLYFTSSTWVAMSPDPRTIETLERLSRTNTWVELEQTPGFERWSDSYGSILPLLIPLRRNK